MLSSPEVGVRSNEEASEKAAPAGRSEAQPAPPGGRSIARFVRYGRILTRLDGFEWKLLMRMSVLLTSFLIAQRKDPLPDLMAKFDSEPEDPSTRRIRPGRLVYLVTGLVRFTLGDRYCMKRSILIFHYLRKWSYDAKIKFGVVKGDQGLQGHAWVELNGLPLAERGDPRQRYAVTYSYPTA